MKTVLIYSGGLDSTVLLYDLINKDAEVFALTVDYGQRHSKEIEYARRNCKELVVGHRLANLSSIKNLLAGSSQTSADVDVPEGHYTEESMKATVVPNRNMIMLSIAAGWAMSERFDSVAYAAHSGDHAIYPDCREAFVNAMRLAIGIADWHKVDLLAPYLNLS
jgi:7-cyano-7-deazaguanine synthase